MERESFARPAPKIRLTSAAMRAALAPSPWGEGWGEGERIIRKLNAYSIQDGGSSGIFGEVVRKAQYST